MKRRTTPELMDDPECPEREVRAALRGLRRLNRFTLSRRIVRRLVGPGTVLDVATGSADIPRHLLETGRASAAVGLDVSATILREARAVSPGVGLVRGDGLRLPFRDRAFDTAVCHLFAHHLEDEEEVVTLLREMGRVARAIVVVDLLRRRRLLFWVRLVTALSPSRLIRYDGPVSVRRAWTARELTVLLGRAGLSGTVRRHSFHRVSVTARGNGHE